MSIFTQFHRGEALPEFSQPINTIDASRRRGRAALSNSTGRFETKQREDLDDGWGSLDALPAFKTQINLERPRTIITTNDSPDLSFERSINPYRGCEHGCVYCFARPTHAFMGLSPGLDFETQLFVKQGAADVLTRELSHPKYQVKTIAIGTNTDPYQPIERQHRVMRQVLEVLARANHPVGIVTKSALVARDIDILAPMAAKGLAKVAISITTLDRDLARKMEPRASTPQSRLDVVAQLANAGIPVSLMVAPIIPAINDAEIETIMTRAHAMGAREIGYVMLRLPHEVTDIFAQWLVEHYPDKARHVLSLVRSMRDGKLYDANFGDRMRGTGPYAWMIGRRVEVAATKIGYRKNKLKLETKLFTPPIAETAQMTLF